MNYYVNNKQNVRFSYVLYLFTFFLWKLRFKTSMPFLRVTTFIKVSRFSLLKKHVFFNVFTTYFLFPASITTFFRILDHKRLGFQLRQNRIHPPVIPFLKEWMVSMMSVMDFFILYFYLHHFCWKNTLLYLKNEISDVTMSRKWSLY